MAPLVTNARWSDVRWTKFKISYMWKNDEYYLRRTKFVVYQIVMIGLGVGSAFVSETLAHWKQQSNQVSDEIQNASLDVSDIAAACQLQIVIGGILSTVFSFAMLADLFWPERKESKAMQRMWKWTAVLMTFCQLAAAITLTVVLAVGHADFRSADPAALHDWRNGHHGSFVYSHRGTSWAAVIFAWVGEFFTAYSTFVMWNCYAYINAHGPFAQRMRSAENVVEEESDGQSRRECEMSDVA